MSYEGDSEKARIRNTPTRQLIGEARAGVPNYLIRELLDRFEAHLDQVDARD